MSDKISGLDMINTFEWYKNSGVSLPDLVSGQPLPFEVENPNHIGLSSDELAGLYNLFPEPAKNRSILRKIVGQPTTWFSNESTCEQPIPTNNLEDALTPTSIVPSYIDYTPWGELKKPTADIWLYDLPKDLDDKTKKLVLAEGFLHEVAHSIIQPLLYVDTLNLDLQDGTVVNGFDYVMEFAKLAENHSPISHYAATYRGKDNKFKSDNPNYNALTAISEELCETVAAYFLGFAFCNDQTRAKDPFKDRPKVKEWVHRFLNAKIN